MLYAALPETRSAGIRGQVCGHGGEFYNFCSVLGKYRPSNGSGSSLDAMFYEHRVGLEPTRATPTPTEGLSCDVNKGVWCLTQVG